MFRKQKNNINKDNINHKLKNIIDLQYILRNIVYNEPEFKNLFKKSLIYSRDLYWDLIEINLYWDLIEINFIKKHPQTKIIFIPLVL